MATQTTASQPAQPMPINIPQPPSNPDTPSEMPGTPTSTTTSLSALSTTAIKDGQRGGHVPPLIPNGNTPGGGVNGANGSANGGQPRGHHHQNSANSLEAERADRISRIPGLYNVSTLRPGHAAGRGSVGSGGRLGGAHGAGSGTPGGSSSGQNGMMVSPLATPTSNMGGGGGYGAMVVPGPLTPAYFDAHGQPMAITKMSTVGTASATDSLSGRTLGDDGDTDTGDRDTLPDDDDLLSIDASYRHGTDRGGDDDDDDDDDRMMMDDDNLDAASRSAGGYEDRMSDDGSVSLVGFGEGAGSTVSGPIYHRRPLPPTSSATAMGAMGAMASTGLGSALERTNSGLSDGAVVGGSVNGSVSGNVSGGGLRREFVRFPLENIRDSDSISVPSVGGVAGSVAGSVGGNHLDSPGSGMALDGGSYTTGHGASAEDDDVFVDHRPRHHHNHNQTHHHNGPHHSHHVGPRGAVTAANSSSSTPSSSASLSMPPMLGGNIIQPRPSALRETQQPRSYQQQQQQAAQQTQFQGNGTAPTGTHECETAEQIMRSVGGFEGHGHGHDTRSGAGGVSAGASAGNGGAAVGSTALGSPNKTGGRLGRFYFEERK